MMKYKFSPDVFGVSPLKFARQFVVKLRYFIAILILGFAFPALSTTYYIDYVNGSDGNNGTSTTSPWQRHPYMVGFSGGYTHSPGDSFIFKGGVTWPAACFPIQFSVGGTASKYDYYGVSPTYYTGSAWSRPIFNGQYLVGGLFWMHVTANYVYIDSFDLQGVMAQSNYGQASIAMEGGIGVTITNCYIHKWSRSSAVTTDGEFGGFFNSAETSTQGLGAVLITHCEIGNNDGDGNCGACMWLPGEVAFCKLHDAPEGILHGGYSVHDTEIYNILPSFDVSQHLNIAYLDAWNGALAVTGPCKFYNNYIHDCYSYDEPIYCNGTVPVGGSYPYADFYIYNNVFVDNDYETVQIDAYGGTPMRVYVNNNTFDNNLGTQINVVQRGIAVPVVSYFNNLMIGVGSTYLNGATSISQGNNIFISEATANAAGYVPAQYYYPPSASAMTVGQGANLTSLSSAGYPAITSDTSRGNNEAPYARPATGAWDIGAYQYHSGGSTGGGGTTLSPPVVSAITQNAADVDPNTSGLQVYEGTTVQYSGSATDPNGLPFTWQWAYTVNGGAQVVFQSGSGTIPAINYTYATGTAGNTYIWSLIVTDSSNLTAQSQVTVSVEAPPVALTGLSFPATSGIITSPMVVTNGYIYQPIQTGVTNGGRATYTFNITNAGNYVIQALVNAPGDSANSLYVNIDAMPTDPYMTWQIPITTGFQNLVVSWQGTGTYDTPQFVPEVFNLTAGTHQLIIVGREMNTEVQTISILKMVSPPQNLRVLPTIVTAPIFPLVGQ